MLNKKLLTKLLNESFCKQVLLRNKKYVGNVSLKLKQYATYVVDKHMKERNMAMKDVKEKPKKIESQDETSLNENSVPRHIT